MKPENERDKLGALLTELMGPPAPPAQDSPLWSWLTSVSSGHVVLMLNGVGTAYIYTCEEAIGAINARLAKLAPAGWRVCLRKQGPHWVIEVERPSDEPGIWQPAAIRGNLAVHIAVALSE